METFYIFAVDRKLLFLFSKTQGKHLQALRLKIKLQIILGKYLWFLDWNLGRINICAWQADNKYVVCYFKSMYVMNNNYSCTINICWSYVKLLLKGFFCFFCHFAVKRIYLFLKWDETLYIKYVNGRYKSLSQTNLLLISRFRICLVKLCY